MHRLLQAGLIVGGAVVFALLTEPGHCRDAFRLYGLRIQQCPDGALRQTAQLTVSGVRRGAPGTVSFAATGHYTTADSDDVQSVPLDRLRALELTLVDGKQQARPLPVRWSASANGRYAELALPEVPDGDYTLRAAYETDVGKDTVDLPLPLYTPARIHVLTDRPLYEPGNMVRFRAVVLRARDLAPLDHRPGTWVVTDPSGEVLLEEKSPAGPWGVVEGSFPLDKGAPTGAWTVAWVSSDAKDAVPFTVEPFTLPRFRVEATADKTFYRPGDTPAIRGAVLYSSGAPVADAKLDVAWHVDGDWPPPTEWLDKLLPKTAAVGANGRFELALPKIPTDLQGQVTMTAHIGAVDAAGDRVAGTASVLLSADGISVSAVTELDDGLVEGFNNRLYVRVTTPDGAIVPSAKIRVQRAWLPGDNGIAATLDEDGVASLQIDPGAPVNIVIPALPYRPAPRDAAVTRGEPEELIGGQGASLVDQLEMDRWLPALAPCAKWVESDADSADVGLRVAASGTVISAGASPTPLARCVADVLRTKRLPAGGERLYAIDFTFSEPDLSSLAVEATSAIGEPPEELTTELERLAASTRDCLPRTDEGALPRMLTWRLREGAKEVELGAWIGNPAGGTAAAAIGCVTSRIGPQTKIRLAEPAAADAMGVATFSVSLPAQAASERPQATTMLGYELVVSAELPSAPQTKLRIAPGAVPELRLRVDPIIANPGDKITAQLIRGPSFTGQLPKELVVRYLKGEPKKAPLDDERRAQFAIEPGAEGWVEVTGAGKRALVYVKPRADLSLSLKAEKDRYAPGDQAQLLIETLIGGKGGQAAVGLFGVDDSLAQLVPLPGPADMARVRPQVETTSPAFGTLDGQALALGRIRGANAAAATVLRVAAVPQPPALDAVVNATASSRFDAVAELTDRFYIVLAELHVQARRWEASAPPGEKMHPATMAALWKQALAAAEKRGEIVTDSYGRRLLLRRLPADLLALTDPRAVIVVGTRLPEDVENWSVWVAREKP